MSSNSRAVNESILLVDLVEWRTLSSFSTMVQAVPAETFLRHPIPFTGDTSSPDVSRGNALILVRTSHHKLGALRPKFSGLPVAPATFLPFRHYLFTSPCINHAFIGKTPNEPTSPSMRDTGKLLSAGPGRYP